MLLLKRIARRRRRNFAFSLRFSTRKALSLSENAVFVVCLFAAADAAEHLGSCLIPLARDLEILNSLGSSDPPP